jgi:hypothetical protein
VSIGLNVIGFNSLVSQGMMRKPRKLEVGALHDWVDLDGIIYSFERGNNDAIKLAEALNAHYLPATTLGQGKDVVIFSNPASSTGFDIQFPTSVGGLRELRRRPLNEETLELLHDPNKCGLLHKDLVIKLSRPTFIFKKKTPDGGERYLEKSPENTVVVAVDGGQEKLIDLSQPVNYLRLTTVELTAVFNHPAVHRHSKSAVRPGGPPIAVEASKPQLASPPSPLLPTVSHHTIDTIPTPPPPPIPPPDSKGAENLELISMVQEQSGPAIIAPIPVVEAKPVTNLWLEPILAQRPIRYDWLACLIYGKAAEHFGNSQPGKFGLRQCWAIALGDVEDIGDPAFKGIFLTEKRGFGFTNQEHMVRFNDSVALIGTPQSAIEGVGVSLLATAMDSEQRIIFIVRDDYRSKFGVPEQTVRQELARLKEYGALLRSVAEAVTHPEPIEVLWTAPADQKNPADPQAFEINRPADCA